MSKVTEWYGYIIHNRRGPTVYFAGNRPNEVRDYLVRDLQHFINSIETLYTGDLKADSLEDAIESLQSGAWSNDTLPLRGEERQGWREPNVSLYQRLEVKGP